MNESSTSSVTTADVILHVESSNDIYAVRFEPGIYSKPPQQRILMQAALSNKCSQDTAHVIYSMSFGLFQIMGFNLYDIFQCAYKKSIGEYLNSREDQVETFNAWIVQHKINYSPIDLLDSRNRLLFAATYNGPGNTQDYAAKILLSLNALGINNG